MMDLNACIRYDHWANNESLRAITNAKNQNVRALQIAGHILGISEMWLSRVEVRSSMLGSWPSLTPEAIRGLQEQLTNTWLKIVADSHEYRVVTYRNRSGQQVANRLG